MSSDCNLPSTVTGGIGHILLFLRWQQLWSKKRIKETTERRRNCISTSTLPTKSCKNEDALYEDMELREEPVTTSTCVAYGVLSQS